MASCAVVGVAYDSVTSWGVRVRRVPQAPAGNNGRVAADGARLCLNRPAAAGSTARAALDNPETSPAGNALRPVLPPFTAN